MMKIMFAALLAIAASPALAQADDDDCKAVAKQIEARMVALGEKHFYLDVVTPDKVKSARVVGNCEGGKKRIVYRRS